MSARPLLLLPLAAQAALATLSLWGLAPAAHADVVTTASGLKLEGRVEKRPDGSLVVDTDAGRTLVAAKDVLEVKAGDGPRTTWKAQVQQAAPKEA